MDVTFTFMFNHLKLRMHEGILHIWGGSFSRTLQFCIAVFLQRPRTDLLHTGTKSTEVEVEEEASRLPASFCRRFIWSIIRVD